MEKVKYTSNYGDRNKNITEAQFVAEILIERREKKNGLPMFFWQEKKWKTLFKVLTIQANSIIRIYGPTVLIRAVNSDKNITYIMYSKEINPKLKFAIDTIKAKDEELAKNLKETQYDLNAKPKLAKKTGGKLDGLE